MPLKYLDVINRLWSKYNTYNPFEICNQKGIPIEYKDIDKPKGDRFIYSIDQLFCFRMI